MQHGALAPGLLGEPFRSPQDQTGCWAYAILPFIDSPPARNPWDTTRFTGGSSTGAGVAEQAERVGARYAVVLGGNEVQTGQAKLKDLGTREETPVALSELAARVRA